MVDVEFKVKKPFQMTTTQQQQAANLDIINVRLPGYQNLHQILIRQGQIHQIQPMLSFNPLSDPVEQLNLQGDWVSLGGVDLQINGALGLAFPDLTPQDLPKLTEICNYLWQQGIDGFMPTIVTTSVEKIHTALSTISQYLQQPPQTCTAQILGVHLEGPFLNPSKRGAHPEQYLLPLTLDHVKQVLGDYANLVKIITLAPELDATGTVISYLRGLGMIVSLGHSQATAAQAQQAFTLGATMVTHAFNAMPSLHHREPGLLGAALTNPSVQCGFIADGEHISPLMVDLLVRMSRGNLFLVSDALAPLGLPDGIYPWDERHIEVKQGTARLPDGTLSGTTLPLLVGVRNLVQWGVCGVEEAIALATVAPRQALGEFSLISQSADSLLRWRVSASPESLNLTWQRL